MWEALADADRVIFYATVPIAGAVGYGTIRRRIKQDKPLWPQEVREKKVLWPLRFEFDVDHLLPHEEWKQSRVTTKRIRTFARGGFQPVDEDVALEALQGFGPIRSGFSPIAIAPQPSLHNHLIDQLVEAGRLQGYTADKEYPIEKERLDVVWRRVPRSVPTFAFEVHIGGDLYHALGKLKHAYDLWNSRIFLVAQERDRKATETLLSGTFHEIQSAIRFLEVERFREVYGLKQKLKELEEGLGLL